MDGWMETQKRSFDRPNSCVFIYILFIDSCLLFENFPHVDISLCFIRVLIRSVSLKFSMSGLICTAGALDCMAGNKLIEPNLNTHY